MILLIFLKLFQLTFEQREIIKTHYKPPKLIQFRLVAQGNIGENEEETVGGIAFLTVNKKLPDEKNVLLHWRDVENTEEAENLIVIFDPIKSIFSKINYRASNSKFERF